MGHCDIAACNCFHPLQTWLFLIVNGFFGPSGHWYDALCQRCGRGNVDCTGISGRLSSRPCWKKGKKATLALKAQSDRARSLRCDPGEKSAVNARVVAFADARAEEVHGQEALERPKCCKHRQGCCCWIGGYDDAWRATANAFAMGLDALYTSRMGRSALMRDLAAIPVKALKQRRQCKALSSAQALLSSTVYNHVAHFGGDAAGAILAAATIAAPRCPNVLARLDEAEKNGIDVVALVASLCAAGDCVASKPGCPHCTIHVMLQRVAESRGVKLLSHDMSTRFGPCRRAESEHYMRGGCAPISKAEGWLGELVRDAMVRVASEVASSGEVRSFRCWSGKGAPASLLKLPQVGHYRFLLSEIGMCDMYSDGILYRLARGPLHLCSWASAVGMPLGSAKEYGRALSYLPEQVVASP